MKAVIYALLSLLLAIEATTSIARKAGYAAGTPTTGLFLQSSMALLSRVVIFLFMPLMGYLADADLIRGGHQDLLLFLMPVGVLVAVSHYQERVAAVCHRYIRRLNTHGSLFTREPDWNDTRRIAVRRRPIPALNSFYRIVWISYVPYYIAWPLTLALLGEFHNNRGMVLGFASVLNGVSTIMLTLFIDPALAKLGARHHTILAIYDELITVRLKALLTAYVVFAGITMYFTGR